ncbi:MAG TPA: NAD-dependent deacylase [Polyangiaceae bacterium]|jgi:NAD-dependent deacetylase
MIPAQLLTALRRARAVTALTGAGVSAESGIPTFRDAQTGLWAQYRPEELATPDAFRNNPKLVWNWYAFRRKLVTEAAPNAGHCALARMEALFTRFTLITQNVDDLHARAGSRAPIELHGSIMQTRCFDEGTLVTRFEERGDDVPRCPRCGGFLRPGVVWFHEALPSAALAQARAASEQCDIFFSIGTSSVVYPAAELPLHAKTRGALLVEINPIATPLTPHADHVLAGTSATILPELVAQLGHE